MLSLIQALNFLKNAISSKYLDTKAGLVAVANAIKALRVEVATKASIASVTAISDRVTTTEGSITTLNTNVSDLTTFTTALNDVIVTTESNVNALTTFLTNAAIKEVIYMSDGLPTSDDLLSTLSVKVGELGATLVNQQYTLNVEGSKSFTYDVVDSTGNVITQTISVVGSGKILAVVKDGVIIGASAVSYPSGSGGVIEIPPADVATVTPEDAEATVLAILA